MAKHLIKLCYSKITTDANITLSATQLRSYIGYKFANDTEFHHHDDKPYHYPLIQYKRLQNVLCVMGLTKYSDLVMDKISSLQHITLAKHQIPVTNIIFEKTTHEITDKITEYRFLSPWIALNSKNYSKYVNLDKRFRKRFLEGILIGNMLSMLKGMDVKIDYEIYMKIKRYHHIPIVAHEHGFAGFYASFVTNLSLPDYIGVGKSVSKGFGVIKEIRNDN